MMRILRNNYLLIIIILFSAILRFYNFTNRISMGLDSTRDAIVSLLGAKYLQIPLTGPFISIAPVTTGPWYWLQLILARIFLPTSYAPWILLAIYSLLTILIMYRIGILLENKKFALILAFITAVSPQQILISVKLTNPAIVPFFSSLVVLMFVYLLKKKNTRVLHFIFGLLLGIILNIHYNTVWMLVLPFLLFTFNSESKKYLKFGIVSFFLTFVPLIFFDLNNHWYNVRNMLKYLLVDQYNIWLPTRWIAYLFDYWPRLMAFVFGGTKVFGLVLMVVISLVFLNLFLKRKLALPYKLLIFTFFLPVIIVRYYRGERYFWYLQALQPFLFIFASVVVYQLFKLKKRGIFGIIAIISYLIIARPAIFEAATITEPNTLDTIKLISQFPAVFGPGPYKFYKCNHVVKDEVYALILNLEMKNLYSSAGKPLAYYWGCELPNTLKDGTFLSSEQLRKPDKYYPGLEFVHDISQATPSAIKSANWVEYSPQDLYQSAARWWFDEQP